MLVYIATPHSHLYEHAKLVLCEKVFTVNAKKARILISLTREKNGGTMTANTAKIVVNENSMRRINK